MSGQVLTLPLVENSNGAGERPATDVYLTLAKAMGATKTTFPATTGTLPGMLT